jgi:hypothetical protein
MLGEVLANSINATIEGVPFNRTETFSNQVGSGMPIRHAFISILTVVIILTVLLFTGKYLWNNVLHELIPAIKPAKSVWQILGLSVLIMLLFPGSCNCSM